MTDSLRALKILVIAMGVVIVIGTAVVIITIIQRASANWGDAPANQVDQLSTSRTTPLDSTPLTGFGTRTLEIPRDSEIVDMVAQGDRLIVRLKLADGSRQILVLDMMTGARIGVFELRQGP
tara:strand:- start:1743 stop:2108 length:366 start_codon:yes stop_codon:yes gene_type:complete